MKIIFIYNFLSVYLIISTIKKEKRRWRQHKAGDVNNRKHFPGSVFTNNSVNRSLPCSPDFSL